MAETNMDLGHMSLDRQIDKMFLLLTIGAKKWQADMTRVPAELHEGHLRLIRFAVQQRAPYPADLHELLQWLHRPITEWPLPRVAERFPADEPVLVDYAGLSVFFEEWLEDNVSVEESEQKVMREILSYCREATPPLEQAYRAIRTFLIQHPVVEFIKLGSFLLSFDKDLQEKVRDCYEEINLPYPRIYLCPYCGWTLTNRDGEWECTRWVCKRNSDFTHFNVLDTSGHQKYYRLTQGIQKYVQNPGLAELALARKLEERGWDVELYPDVDRVDLRITKDQMRKEIDVKDYSHPKLLADYLLAKMEQENWDKDVIYVVPQYQERLHPDYAKRVLQHLRQSRGRSPLSDTAFEAAVQEVQVMTEREFFIRLGEES